MLATLALALFSNACGSDDSSAESVAPPPIPRSDVDLIDNLVPHHAMAIEMANIEIAKGTRDDVKQMAMMMKATQQDEIARMEQIRMRVDGSGEVPSMDDPHGETDMAELDAATGADVDTMFLENMIPHHAGAVSVAHRALDNLSDAELRDMAQNTIVMQTREMNKMLDMLGE